MQDNWTYFKKSLLAFWATWFTIVFATNACDAFRNLGFLDLGWTFVSGNYGLIVKTTAVHGTPSWVNPILFAGVLAWEGLATGLFWRVFFRYGGKPESSGGPLRSAFLAGFGLFAGFLIADEIFLAYAFEAVHFRILIALLATLLVVYLLPDGNQNQE